MDAVARAFEGKRVFLTGHTGFKGAWLSEWLLALGAEVYGYSLPPPTTPSLFEQLKLAERIDHRMGDVLDATGLAAALAAVQPDFVFHLAAQSLVRASYEKPAETFATNVAGTVNLLEAVRLHGSKPCAVVIVTSDKCYENHEQGRDYQESDPLGGRDPYSASKAAAEIAAAAWRSSFFSSAHVHGRSPRVALATVRAGNVIGGGDWAQDRVVPDCVRALTRGEPIALRNPEAIRPWQHVLEPLAGYLLLATRLRAALIEEPAMLPHVCTSFNFGPAKADHRSVRELVEEILRRWPGQWEATPSIAAVHEARQLHLSTAKAENVLSWRPRWSLSQAVAKTIDWYRSTLPAFERTQSQILEYSRAF